MNNRLCPCGARLDRSSTTRSLKSTGLRMFMSMRTMISWPSDTKVCNFCRLLYVKWKRENSEFSWFISLLEGENDGDDGATTANHRAQANRRNRQDYRRK